MRLIILARKCYSGISISKYKEMNHNKFYFRYVQCEEKVDLSFLFKMNETVRQFNLCRNTTETLGSLATRIGTNVQKVVAKNNKKKKINEDVQIEVKLYDVKNEPLSEKYTCIELFNLEGPIKLKIYDHIYEAVFNAPWVLQLDLPSSILAGFPVYPEHFKTQYANIENCVFNWYKQVIVNGKSDPQDKWELLDSSFSYTPQSKDIGMKLKLECIPGDGKLVGPAVERISVNTVQAGPGLCPFETRHMFCLGRLKQKSFRCVSYNILADLYCDSDFTRTVLHPYCPTYALHIDYRKQLVIKELIGYNADIICLQEVDTKVFNNYLSPLLKTEGFDGLFYRKGKEVAEGLACFYRSERFRKLEEERIVLGIAIQSLPCLQSIWNAIKDNKPLTERLLDRSTVASASILQSNDNSNEILIVCNTHLYFHPDADHIRLVQGGIIIYWLADLKKSIIKKFPDKRISVVICGDFNSVPSCGIYQLFTTGSVPNNLEDWKSNINEAVQDLELQQDLSLGSACGTPPFTNFTAGFADCLDYIYYEKTNLEVEQVIPFPSEEELRLHTAIPSIVFPSDHIALISDLRFK